MLLLRPFSWIYAAVMSVRNFLFDQNVLKQQQFPVPTVSVGNLSVGGTGKTPHTEYILRLLLKEGRKCATLSRGYGRKSHGFRWVSECGSAIEAGDEPWQMQNKFPSVRVSVCENRCEGMRHIMAESPETDVVVLDDAFQHRYIKPGMSILLTEYARPYSKDRVLPEGRLRESRKGARRADLIVVTKCPEVLSREQRQSFVQHLQPSEHQQVLFSKICYGCLQTRDGSALDDQQDNSGKSPLLLCGIANPRPLEAYLKQTFPLLRTKAYADHHDFSLAELQALENEEMVITTEKDYARLSALPLSEGLKKRLYVIPIEICFISQQDEKLFNQKIINYVTENSRNC